VERIVLLICEFEELAEFFQEVIEVGQHKEEYYEAASCLCFKRSDIDSENVEVEIKVRDSIINISNRYKFYLYRKVRQDALISLILESENTLQFKYKSLIFKINNISQ